MDDLRMAIQPLVPSSAAVNSPITASLHKFFNNAAFSDVTLVTSSGKRLHCHKLVLAACSDRLCKLLGQDQSSSTVEIPCMDVNPEALVNLVQFLYASCCNFTLQNVVSIMCTARKYGVPQLETYASNFAQTQISVQSCCELLSKATDGGCERLKIQCLALAAERLDEVSQTEGFLTLSITELKRFLKNPELLSCSEVALFKAMCSWVLRDISREKYLEEIQATVNFPKMAPEEHMRMRELLITRHKQALAASTNLPGPQASCSSPSRPNSLENLTTASAPNSGWNGRSDDGKLEEPILQASPAIPVAINLSHSLPEKSHPTAIGSAQKKSGINQGSLISIVDGPAIPPKSPGTTPGVMQQLQELFVPHLPGAASQYSSLPRRSSSSEGKRADGMGGDDVASGTDETAERMEGIEGIAPNGTGSKVRNGNDIMLVQARGLPTSSSKARSICQVEGCGATLEGLRDYHVRYKICNHHLKISSIIKDGRQQRFCQQCGRFHNLVEFDGAKRSCRLRLQRHNARRRKRLKTDLDEKIAINLPCSTASMLLPSSQSLIRSLPAVQSSSKIVPRTGVTFSHVSPSSEQWSEHPSMQLGPMTCPIMQVSTNMASHPNPPHSSQLIQTVHDRGANHPTTPTSLSWYPGFGVMTTSSPRSPAVDLRKLPSASQVVTGNSAPIAEDGT